MTIWGPCQGCGDGHGDRPGGDDDDEEEKDEEDSDDVPAKPARARAKKAGGVLNIST